MAVVGTWVLGVRFETSRLLEDFVSLFIGVGVVVVLWALLIASTPQELTLSGSVVTIHNSSGRETFDLADGLQPIDIIGTRQRKWAVILHRADRTSVVLRRHDVNARRVRPDRPALPRASSVVASPVTQARLPLTEARCGPPDRAPALPVRRRRRRG